MDAGVPQPARAISMVTGGVIGTTVLVSVGYGAAIGAIDLAYLDTVALHPDQMNWEDVHEVCITIVNFLLCYPPNLVN